jgi:hypothetical protein
VVATPPDRLGPKVATRAARVLRTNANVDSITMNFRPHSTLSRTWLALGAAFLTACASVGPGPTASGRQDQGSTVAKPSLGLFSKIKAPSDSEPVLQLAGRGVQVFRCEKRDGALTWVFRQPDAELLDARGTVVGRHGANFSFENVDGSRLVATITAYDDAPKPTDLRWLLMTTRSFGKGAFEGITYVQRINTTGGMPPERCEAAQLNQVLRVNFTADFVFYRAKSGSPA